MCTHHAVAEKADLDPADVKSYRPISNLSVVSKLLEVIVSSQLVKYLKENDLLPYLQSAYRALHSTETAVLKVLDDLLLELDSGDLAMLTLLDLSSAFDSVDHDTLLQRLQRSYGLGGQVLKWFAAYLCGHVQHVHTSTACSTPADVLYGVPQGSVLGPIPFLLYTADLLQLVKRHQLIPHAYADDTQIDGFCRPADSAKLRENVSACIDEVSTWMASNQLQLNQAKTEVLWCSSSRRQHQIPSDSIRIGSTNVQPVTSIRDLGVYIDADMTMRTNATAVARTCFADPERAAISVTSCLTDLGPCSVIKSARLVFSARLSERITPLLRELHWLRVTERVTFGLCVLAYRCLHGTSPSYLAASFLRTSDVDTCRRLRSADSSTLVVPSTRRTTLGDRAFPVASARAWNSLPSSVRNAPSLMTFRRDLKTVLFRSSFDLH